MAKFNVYVSDDLRRRMEKAKGVTWSQVACEAFERQLGELAASKKEKAMDDVIQRLRASAVDDASESVQRGRAAGREWVKDTASARELRLLAKAREACGNDWTAVFGNGMNGSPDQVLVQYITDRPCEEVANIDVDEFWTETVGAAYSDREDVDYVLAFADAALELWSEVAGKL